MAAVKLTLQASCRFHVWVSGLGRPLSIDRGRNIEQHCWFSVCCAMQGASLWASQKPGTFLTECREDKRMTRARERDETLSTRIDLHVTATRWSHLSSSLGAGRCLLHHQGTGKAEGRKVPACLWSRLLVPCRCRVVAIHQSTR